MQAARKPATYAELVALGDESRAEILAGEITRLPAPLPEHGRTQGVLWKRVGGPFDDDDGRGGPGGWWILVETDVQLGVNDVVRPDLSGWHRERLPSPWGHRPVEVVPDWICEIVSPSNEAHDRIRKKRLYARHGVPFYWIVDPAARTLEALKLVDGVWVDAGSYEDGATARVPPFEAVELEIGRLFPPRG